MVYRYPKPVHVKPAPDGSKGLCELALEKSSGYTAAQDKDEAREERAEEEEREKVAEAVTKSVRGGCVFVAEGLRSGCIYPRLCMISPFCSLLRPTAASSFSATGGRRRAA